MTLAENHRWARMVEQSGGADGRTNNFDTLRLVAATAVLVSHSFTLAGAGAEPLVGFSHDPRNSLGHVSVLIFFAISGYLITASYLNARTATAFVWRRALRILPGLAVVSVVSAFVIGPLVSTLSVESYFSKAQPYRYVLGNLAMHIQYYLPGVFSATPYPNAVNGSLWTLPLEVECYALVLVLGICGLLNRWALLIGAALLTALLGFRGQDEFLQLATTFAVGALLKTVDVRLDWRIAAGCLLGSVAALHFGGFAVVAAWCGTYFVHFVARSPQIQLPRLRFDPSYGMYIWAFPVQQVISEHLRGPSTWWLSLTLALVITFALATASFFLVEKPAMRLKYALRPLLVMPRAPWRA